MGKHSYNAIFFLSLSLSSWASFFMFSRKPCEKKEQRKKNNTTEAERHLPCKEHISICLLILALIFFDKGNEFGSLFFYCAK